MSSFSIRRDWISKPIFGWAQHVLPSLSDTEREAIEAGDAPGLPASGVDR